MIINRNIMRTPIVVGRFIIILIKGASCSSFELILGICTISQNEILYSNEIVGHLDLTSLNALLAAEQ